MYYCAVKAHRSDLRRRLTRLAATQSGYFTAAQARDVGYSYQAQKYHVDHGNWQKVDRGLFRLPEWPPGEHEDLVRWTLWSRGKAVVSHETALVVHNLGDANPTRVHLTVPPGFSARAPGAVLHYGEIPSNDVEQFEGYRVTTPLRTLLDVAADGFELDQFTTAVRDALDQGMVTRRLLRDRADEFDDRAALWVERALSSIAEQS